MIFNPSTCGENLLGLTGEVTTDDIADRDLDGPAEDHVLAHLSLGARTAVTQEAGAVAHRVAWIAVLALGAMALGGALLAIADLLRTGGIAIEVVGVAAAVGAVGLLVVAARETRASG